VRGCQSKKLVSTKDRQGGLFGQGIAKRNVEINMKNAARERGANVIFIAKLTNGYWGSSGQGEAFACPTALWTCSAGNPTEESNVILRILGAVALIAATAACGGGADTASAPPAPRLTTLAVSIAASPIVAGTTTTANAVGRDQFGQPIAIGPVSWVSSNGAVATVDAAGTVTGVASGTVTITGAAGGAVGVAPLSVTPAPVLTRLALSLTATSVVSGTTVVISVTGVDQFGAAFPVPAVMWSSSAPTVVSVQSDGTAVTALAGTATITARVGSVTATTQLAVIPGAPARLAIVRPAGGVFSGWRFGTQPQVAVTDQAGNRITSDNGRVVQLSSTGGTVGRTAATTVGGVATFVDAGAAAPIGTVSTILFTTPGLAIVTQTATVVPFSFENGTRLVGTDVPPGRYRSVNAPAALSCYWARLRNTTGTDAVIAQDIGAGPRLMELLASDVAVESSRCAPWTAISGPVTSSRTAPFGDGTYLVGVDIEPGTWRTNGVGASCYWARLRNLNRESSVIAQNIGEGPAIMTVLPTDVAVDVSRCGTWTRSP
jgi:hypothetical protein